MRDLYTSFGNRGLREEGLICFLQIGGRDTGTTELKSGMRQKRGSVACLWAQDRDSSIHFNLAALNLLIFFSLPSSSITGRGVISSP